MDCPECGAKEQKCESRYHECLAMEFSQAGYGAVHHLTVTTYMLQHSSKLTKEGWLFERKLLREFLVEEKDPSLVVKQNRDKLDSGTRGFKITSADARPVIDRQKWTRTILDVRLDTPEAYCQDVVAWAQTVLDEAETSEV